MDWLSHLLEKISAPFVLPFSPNERIFVFYLLTAGAIAFLVYAVARDRKQADAQDGFLRHVFPKEVYGHKSAWTDYKFFLVNKITYPLLFAPLIVGTYLANQGTGDLLTRLFGADGPGFASGPLAVVFLTLAVLLANDLGIFLTHLLQHRIPALWEFHKVHHSAEVLTPITVYRMHPVDTLFTSSVAGIMAGVASGSIGYLYADPPGMFAAFGTNIGLFAFYLLGYNLRHSHIWLPYPGWLSRILISPAQHQIHHSSATRHHDKNMGFLFAFWDWMAGTLYVPKEREAFDFGLSSGEQQHFDGVVALYLRPFRRLFAKARGRERRLLRTVGAGSCAVLLASLAVLSQPMTAPLPQTPYLEEMTWVEVREALARGKSTVIIPTGGVEQNGPHMVLGKHNYIVRATAGAIAEALGDALVAPVVAYVPEGETDPPSDHMLWAGTISVPEPVFAAVLEHSARSLRAHGFTTIAFIGDSGGNQASQAAVAIKLSAEWAEAGVRVLHIGDYYAVDRQREHLMTEGETVGTIGRHAGIRDTSELLAVYAEGIRQDRLAPGGGVANEDTGVNGDPTRATVERGEALLALKIDAALRQIRLERAAPGS